MFVTLTLMPLYLAAAPFNLSSDVIGACYVPSGVGLLAASIVGGVLADRGFAKYPEVPESRFIYVWPIGWLLPISVIGFGFSVWRGGSLAAVMITTFLVGFGFSSLFGVALSYFAIARPHAQATAVSVAMFLGFGGSGVLLSVSVQIVDAMGVQWFMLMLGCISIVSHAWVTYATLTAIDNATKLREKTASVDTTEDVKETDGTGAAVGGCQGQALYLPLVGVVVEITETVQNTAETVINCNK